MNLRKRSKIKNLKDNSDDSDRNQSKTAEKVKESSKKVTEEFKKKDSKYFSDENKSPLGGTSESEDDFVEVKPKLQTKPENIRNSSESEEEFVEVKAKARVKAKTKSKTTKENTKSTKNPTVSKKTLKTSNSPKKTSNATQKSPLKNKTKIENDIDALLHMERAQITSNISKKNHDEDEDDEDFEEVEMENLHEADARIASMSRETVEVTIGNKKAAKKTIDMAARFERIFKALNKKYAIAAIKTHLLCWLNYGFYLNNICCDPELCAIALSMKELEVKENKGKTVDLKVLKNSLVRFKNSFNIDKMKSDEFLNKNVLITRETLINSITTTQCRNYLEYVLMVLIALRNMSLSVRLIVCFEVIVMPDQRKNNKKNGQSKNSEDSDSDNDVEEMDVDNNSDVESKSKGNKRKSDQIMENFKKKTKKAKIVKLAESTDDEKEAINKEEKDESNNKEDIETNKKAKALLKTKPVTKNDFAKILSTDDEKNSSSTTLTDTNYRNHWLEVYLVEEERWVTIEPYTLKIDCSNEMEKIFGKQILYACGYDNENKVKDLTKRYASEWLTNVRRSRISQLDPKKLWWERTLMFYQPIDPNLDIQEEIQLKKMLLSKELPKSLPEFKDHPLYVLPKHLLKFQSIYPENATPISHFRNEKIYLRENLRTLHSRQTWLKFARIVKPFENAYKVVKGRLKHSEYKAGMRENPDLDLFGFWQTKEFEPPIAENGRIPRNEFGNVELFQPHMLPIGCVHLKNMPNLNRLCKKLDIDCVAAVVGFDAHGGFSHAVYDGWIVCEEFKETVVMAYREYEQEEAKKLIQKKKDKILSNWARLTKLLLIRERLKLKYESKTSVFCKIDKKGKGVSKCLNEDEKNIIEVNIQPTTSSCVNTEIVGGNLNSVNKNEKNSEKETNDNEMPQTSSTKESAFLKIASRGRSTVSKKHVKPAKLKNKTKNKVKDDYEEEDDENIDSDSEDPEFDFKVSLKSRRLKNPTRNTKRKPIIESDEESSKEENLHLPTHEKEVLKLVEPSKKLDKFGDVNLSESEED